MTPKEKAKELIEKYIKVNGNSFFAKECALIAVDETLNACNRFDMPFWEQVKTELLNL